MNFVTKYQMKKENRYGGGWLLFELSLFLFLTVVTGGAYFFFGYLFSNLNTPPAGTDEPAYPWERRNRAGFVLFVSTLKGRCVAGRERLLRRMQRHNAIT